MAKTDNDTTHFGFRTVAAGDKADLVRDVFDSVATRYDLMNDLMSAGMHRLWKRFTVDQAALRPGDVALDLAGGTGDLARAFCRRVGKQGHVVLADINAAMLRQGRSRLVDAGGTLRRIPTPPRRRALRTFPARAPTVSAVGP